MNQMNSRFRSFLSSRRSQENNFTEKGRSLFKLNRVLSTFGLCFLFNTHHAFANTREFFVNAIELSEVKMWLPSNFTVKKGDTVVFHLKSKIKGANNIHGFTIKDYGVEVLVDAQGIVQDTKNKESKKDAKDKDGKEIADLVFVADKAGVFDIRCHIHPAHVGGQLVVLE